MSTEYDHDETDDTGEMLQVLGQRLSTLAQEQYTKRISLETRWLEDIRQYNGKYSPDVEAKLKADETKSSVFVNITRPKANTGEARLMDMLFPAGEKNWGIDPTPIPELIEDLNNKSPTSQVDPETGAPRALGDLAKDALEEAKKRCAKMEMEIADQLAEAGYEVSCREMTHDAVVLGTGVLKGPVVVNSDRKAWQRMTDDSGETLMDGETELWESVGVSEKRPIVERVDPWNFFPDMSANHIRDAEFVFERHYMTKAEVRALARRPGFIKEQVKQLLRVDPREHHSAHNDHMQKLREISGIQSVLDERRYEVWEYHGPVDKEDLLACGCDVDPDDPMEEFSGVIWFCGPYILKAALNPLEEGDNIYSVFCWERDDTSIFGFGVPYQMRNPQRVINASWRMILENGGLSVGPQIVVNRKAVSPADGDWKLRGRKVWYLQDESKTVHDAFAAHEISSHQSELAAIFETARRLADEETSMPLIAQGDSGPHITGTSSGMSMLMNNANVVLRRVVKNFDDDITTPVITRMFGWNMKFNPRNDIKGDMTVVARGTSVLLIKEMQQQALMQMLNITNNPTYGPMMKLSRLLRKSVQSMHLSPDELVLSEEEIEQQMAAAAENQGPDPVMAKIEAELQMNRERIEQRDREVEAQMVMKDIEREIAMMKLSADQNVSLQEIDAALRRAMMENKVKRQNAVDEMMLKAQRGEGI